MLKKLETRKSVVGFNNQDSENLKKFEALEKQLRDAKIYNEKMLEQMNSKQFEEAKSEKKEKITEIKRVTETIVRSESKTLHKQNTVPIPNYEPQFITMNGSGKLGKKKMSEI